MALEISFCISEKCDCKSISFKELTGTYNASNNLGGWGAPNNEVAAVTIATLTVTSPTNVVTEIDLLAENFPTEDKTQELLILNTDLGYTEETKLDDGVWKFQIDYYDADEDETISTTVYKMFLCKAKCCVANMFAALPVTECNCDSSKLDNAIFADRMLTALKYAAMRGDTSKFTNLLTLVNNLCSNDCGCGCS